MDERESITIGASIGDGITGNTGYADEFDLVLDAHVDLQSMTCSEGVCSTEWKPQRQNAA